MARKAKALVKEIEVLRFFEEAPLEDAQVVFEMVEEIVRRRKQAVVETCCECEKCRRKRGQAPAAYGQSGAAPVA